MTDEEMERLATSADTDQLHEVHQALSAWPGESPPDALVERTLAAVAADQAALTAEGALVEQSGTRSSSFPWRQVAAVLLAAFFVAVVVAVQFGGKVKALFETSDAEIDTVDTGL